MIADALLTLHLEKPAAGGRMLARHDGMVVLVAGGIPGEVVRARIERTERSLAFATAVDVVEPHAARRAVTSDPRCGGAVYAHIEPAEQRRLKGELVLDALRRVGRVPWDAPVPVAASPERGYRMRARLHVREGLIGFFLEGTHRVCDPVATGQLHEAVEPVFAGLASELRHAGLRGEADIDLSENVPADQRAIHIEFDPDASVRLGDLRLTVPGVSGLSCSTRGRHGEHLVGGMPFVSDTLTVTGMDGAAVPVVLRRHARAFFQGNRFLLQNLVETVVGACPQGSVVDLYSGVGLFGVALAASGRHDVVAVEGHRASARDLRANAEPYGEAIRVYEAPVEQFLAQPGLARPDVLVLDPPRTGMTREALAGVAALAPARVVFVSCDVATFARDVRRFVDAGYGLRRLQAFDLFPNTAHVEVVAELSRM